MNFPPPVPLTPKNPARSSAGPEYETDSALGLAGGILVCGGRSRRMGDDKALLTLDGQTLLERSAGLLEEQCAEFVLACGAQARYAQFGWPLAIDSLDDGGPLAGIAAGLAALQTKRAIVIPCDMPNLSAELLRDLFRHALEKELDACFLSTDRGIEPLCAVYSRRCLAAMEAALVSGKRKVTSFLEVPDLGSRLRRGEMRIEPLSDDYLLRNMNTRAEFDGELMRRGGTPGVG